VKHLLCFGFGFTAKALSKRFDSGTWKITGTSRSDEGVAAIKMLGFEGLHFDEMQSIPKTVTHVLSSVPPRDDGDPVVLKFAESLSQKFEWLAYLSTTGVYGDHGGGVVTEETPITPNSDRARRRVAAEAAWTKVSPHIFRLPGIYGPGRNQLESVKDGTARRVIKPGQIFSRIHVDDIAGILHASINAPNPGRIYNVADDHPCPPQDVVTFAASLLKMEPPPEIEFEKANLSPMARSFYDDSKRVSNARTKTELGYKLIYPDYKMGLTSIFNNSPHLRVQLN
jgi:nucleoside-diphosphate-sugar epimerase